MLVGYDHYLPEGGFCGASVVTNCFGQPPAYVYVSKIRGHHWRTRFFLSLSGGVVYGYVGAHKYSLPVNHNAFGPVVLPDLGYRLTKNDALNFNVVGTAALTFAYSRRF